MEEQLVIGKGTWIDKVADNLIKREKQLGRSLDLVRVESGLGASGIPHIGSMADAARAYGIALALENLGFKSQLIAYSDDMDGLRKIPHGLPSWLQDHIAKPVSSVPDPFGSCHTSYGAHMSSLLLESLDKAGIKYCFQSGREAYQQGILINQIDTILKNSGKLGQMIARLVGQEKYIEVLPYFPICHNCGRLYTAVAQEYLPEKKKVAYICQGSKIGRVDIKGCGTKGEADITKGEGKLAWKVEFAARWQALDIRFEGYGKDIMDSVKVNDWISEEILAYSHPMHIKYEMFLDKTGKKISKSAGNVLTPQMWLRYGTAESILLLLFKRIIGTRHIGLDDVPIMMDEYDYYEDIYFGKVKEDNVAKVNKIKGIYEYVNKLNPPKQPNAHIPYLFIAQQASIFPTSSDRDEKVFNRLLKYGMVKQATESIMQKIRLACNWSDDNMMKDEKFQVFLSDSYRKAVQDLIEAIRRYAGLPDTPDNAKDLQSTVFSIARSNNMEPKEFFILLYRMFLNADRGPRIGNYFLDLGIDKAISILHKYL
ncbi:MAG: lysine--tRNA ligase [Thermoproteota archaeon]|nr:lysine--tRNA ligase [Thermoproteota archaeon]